MVREPFGKMSPEGQRGCSENNPDISDSSPCSGTESAHGNSHPDPISPSLMPSDMFSHRHSDKPTHRHIWIEPYSMLATVVVGGVCWKAGVTRHRCPARPNEPHTFCFRHDSAFGKRGGPSQ